MNIFLLSLIAAVFSQAFGWAWHGPIFGKKYAQSMDVDLSQGQPKMGKSFGVYLGLNFVANLVMSYVLYFFLFGFGAMTLGSAVTIAAVLFAGFVLPVFTIMILWNGRQPKGQLALWLISFGYQVINLFIWTLLFTLFT